jgi:glycosyltransferase involved in cell wall biosynthesis
MWWPLRKGTRVATTLERIVPSVFGPAKRLADLIEKLRPDLVHTLEMQQCAYLTQASRDILQRRGVAFPPWIYSCWGSDIYYYGHQAEHYPRIRSVLSTCDYLITDCERDVRLARQFGFGGEVLGVFPGPGGFHLGRMKGLIEVPSVPERRTIAVKGYHRPLVALRALEMCSDLLAGKEVVIYSVHDECTVSAANALSETAGVPVTLLRDRRDTPNQDEILRLFGRSRVAIALSHRDGTPNTMLEAMVMGAFPIQSDTISTREWIADGANGFLVHCEDAEGIAAGLRKALTDDRLVERAAAENAALTEKRIDYRVVQPRVLEAYRRVFDGARERRATQPGHACCEAASPLVGTRQP